MWADNKKTPFVASIVYGLDYISLSLNYFEEFLCLRYLLNVEIKEAMDRDENKIPGLTQEYVNELVAARLDPIMERMMRREKENQAALRESLAELQDMISAAERQVEDLRRRKAGLEAEFPRRLLVHCPEVDADWVEGEPRRPIPAGAVGGAASDPPLWATAENRRRAEEANVAHLIGEDVDRSELDDFYVSLRQPSEVRSTSTSIAVGSEVRLTWVNTVPSIFSVQVGFFIGLDVKIKKPGCPLD